MKKLTWCGIYFGIEIILAIAAIIGIANTESPGWHLSWIIALIIFIILMIITGIIAIIEMR